MTMQLVLPSGVTLQRRETPADPADLPAPVLERIALRWARRARLPPDQVIMREEDLGWVLWAPGATVGHATFVDKRTGRVVSFANPTYLDEQYRERLEHERGVLPRPGAAGPRIETPGVVAEVLLGLSSTGTASSVRTDDPPALHPLVRARLSAIPARARVRGAEWHPELVALGHAVQSVDADRRRLGQAPLSDLDGEVRVRLWRVREPADPRQADSDANVCATCTQALGVRPLWPDKRPAPQPGASFRQRLLARRRLHRRPAQAQAAETIDQVVATPGVGHQHVAFPAVAEALAHYLGASSTVQVPGRSVRTAPFHVDPARAADTADTLARVARRVGAPLFPLGTAGHEGILAIDPDRRVFLVDETGEWSLGTGLPTALDTLLLGRSAPRVRG